jgi:predicted ATPase
VNAFGVQGTADMLNDRLDILAQGRRTALPRHQTLATTFDWSYELLSEEERSTLRRLSVFVGPFNLAAACSVVGHCGENGTEVILASLIAKSFVAADVAQHLTRYRLLDTTRAYVRRKLTDGRGEEDAALRHAVFFTKFLNDLDLVLETRSEAIAVHGGHLGNVRAALEWTFSPAGNIELGINLAAAAAPLFLGLSLLTECRRWCDRALAALDQSTRGGRPEMELQAALGLSLMFTDFSGENARDALERALTLAQELEDLESQLRIYGRLHLFHYRTGNFEARPGCGSTVPRHCPAGW